MPINKEVSVEFFGGAGEGPRTAPEQLSFPRRNVPEAYDRNAREESRAHKVLHILSQKDRQMDGLQRRIQELESMAAICHSRPKFLTETVNGLEVHRDDSMWDLQSPKERNKPLSNEESTTSVATSDDSETTTFTSTIQGWNSSQDSVMLQKSKISASKTTIKSANYKTKGKQSKKLYEKYKKVCGQLKKEKQFSKKILETCKQLDKNNKILIDENGVIKSDIRKYKNGIEQANEIIMELREKLLFNESNWTGAEKMKSRLSAANQTMTKQRKQIDELQNQLEDKKKELNNIRNKLSRSEAVGTNRQNHIERLRLDLEKWETQAKSTQERNQSLRNELKAEKELLEYHRCLLSKLRSVIGALEMEKSDHETETNSHIMELEKKVTDLKMKLVQKDIEAEEMAKSTKEKFMQIKKSLCQQIELALEKLIKSDNKIKELYSTMELLIKKIHQTHHAEEEDGKGNTIKEEAVKVACTILKLNPEQVHEILDSNAEDKIKLKKKLETCQNLINMDVFANELSKFLFDVITKPNDLDQSEQ